MYRSKTESTSVFLSNRWKKLLVLPRVEGSIGGETDMMVDSTKVLGILGGGGGSDFEGILSSGSGTNAIGIRFRELTELRRLI